MVSAQVMRVTNRRKIAHHFNNLPHEQLAIALPKLCEAIIKRSFENTTTEPEEPIIIGDEYNELESELVPEADQVSYYSQIASHFAKKTGTSCYSF